MCASKIAGINFMNDVSDRRVRFVCFRERREGGGEIVVVRPAFTFLRVFLESNWENNQQMV